MYLLSLEREYGVLVGGGVVTTTILLPRKDNRETVSMSLGRPGEKPSWVSTILMDPKHRIPKPEFEETTAQS